MTKYTIEEIKELKELGFTNEQIVALMGGAPKVSGAKKATESKAPKSTKDPKALAKQEEMEFIKKWKNVPFDEMPNDVKGRMFNLMADAFKPMMGSNKQGTGDKAPEPKEYGIEDVKFDKYNDGNCNWSYYKEVRKAYCYRRQGCKVWKGTITKPEGFVFDEKKWEEDKKAFEAKYPYIKKADRK